MAVNNPLSVQVFGERSLPAVVLLHSIATRGALWSPQTTLWSSHFHLIVPDLPGHGDSPAAAGLTTLEDYAGAINDLLDDLGVRRAAMVGISLGGMIAQAYALRFPQRLSALVLAQTLARVNPEAAAQWELRKRTARELGMRVQVQPTLQRWFTADFLRAAPMTVEWVGNMIASTSTDGYEAAAGAIQHLNFFEQLAGLSVPTLVVAGADDVAASPAIAQALCGKIPGAQLAIVERAAHLANVEQPIVFAEVVGGFLASVLTSRA
jgi:3-oxoadipate enol-lactonase